MNFNQRGNPQVYSTGCSAFGCVIALFLAISLIQGGIYFLIRYVWVIVLIGGVIWLFRKWTNYNNIHSEKTSDTTTKSTNWQRDFENSQDTAYDNIDRDFEEIDETEEDFDDF